MGNELNGAWHLYVCDEEYASTYVEPTYGVSRCQFGSDAAALLDGEWDLQVGQGSGSGLRLRLILG